MIYMTGKSVGFHLSIGIQHNLLPEPQLEITAHERWESQNKTIALKTKRQTACASYQPLGLRFYAY